MGCLWAPDIAENPDEDAEVGLLFLPSTMVKLSDLECPLPSLAPLAEFPASGRGDGLPFASEGPSCGVVLLPFGVASRSEGGVGRDEGRWTEARGGRLGIEGLSVSGFWLGEGGIASPRRGVRAPPALLLPPGIGGRSSGTGEGLDPVSGLGISWFWSMLPGRRSRFYGIPSLFQGGRREERILGV